MESIQRRLINYDYLRVEGDSPADMRVVQRGKNLAFQRLDRKILEVSTQTFFSKTGKLLREFSERSDRHLFFRRFTFFSLLMGFPLILYVLLFSSFRAGIWTFLSKETSLLSASAICLTIGIVLFLIIIAEAVLQMNRIRRIFRDQHLDTELLSYVTSLGAALVVYLCGYMMTHSILYTEILWILLAMPICLENSANELLARQIPKKMEDSTGVAQQTAPVSPI